MTSRCLTIMTTFLTILLFAAMAQAHSVIEGAIRENGLAGIEQTENSEGKRVYHLTCSREVAEQLVADLSSVWDNSESVELTVESDRFNGAVAVDSPTLEQATRIIGADSAEASLAVARLENFNREMPGRDIVTAGTDEVSVAALPPALPKPRMVSAEASGSVIPSDAEGTVKATLTIVLDDARK